MKHIKILFACLLIVGCQLTNKREIQYTIFLRE